MADGHGVNGLTQGEARLVDRMFRGATPSDLPVARASADELVINLKTAETLGPTIPPALQLHADRVIQ